MDKEKPKLVIGYCPECLRSFTIMLNSDAVEDSKDHTFRVLCPLCPELTELVSNVLQQQTRKPEPLLTPEEFTWQCIRTLTGHESAVRSVAISPNGQTLVSGSGDHTIKLWNVKTGDLLRTFTGHKGFVGYVAIHPDGQTLASASDDGTIKLWNLKTGDLLHTFTEHESYIESVIISPDGQTLVSGSGDMTIKLWEKK